MRFAGLLVIGSLFSVPACAPVHAAEGYPTKPIRMLIGFPGGSSSDIVEK